MPTVDGGWTQWAEDGPCSATCGDDGVQSFTRACAEPTPECSGLPCDGDETKTKECNRVDCPIECEYESVMYNEGQEVTAHPDHDGVCTSW